LTTVCHSAVADPSISRVKRVGLDYPHMDQWRQVLGTPCVTLDNVRAFTNAQKNEIFRRDAGKCAVCGENVDQFNAEYNHYPVPYRDGGRSEVGNGRLVHQRCHPRGRPVEHE
jgi:hypothetical protein